MRFVSFLSFVALAHVSSTRVSSISSTKCTDDANYKHNDSDHLTCKELQLEEHLRLSYCVLDEVAAACKITCGVCCYDDPSYVLFEKSTCEWIGYSKSRRKRYCFKFKPKMDEVKAACPSTCGQCRDHVTGLWSFIVLPDWHKAEYFATNPRKNSNYYKQTLNQIKFINENYGGDLVVLPGDTNGALPGEKGGGKWDTVEFANAFKPNSSITKRISLAGKNCYKAVRDLFEKSGYPLILVTLGDHEIGGNSWGKQNERKIQALPVYHAAFEKWYNTDSKTKKLFGFKERLGSVSSRPEGTEFEKSSFAYRYKNVLFVTVNAFKQMSDTFLERKKGLGGEGVITCTVDGKHLRWFTNVLKEARKDASIRHIIVQSHVPVIQPVRQVACSGQFMDNGEDSPFWKTMVRFGVDIYLAGEVHANTATKDPDSNLVQIVSRGNQFSNFLKIEVTDYTINVTSYNEVGTKRFNNMNYEVHGRLLIDKSDCMSLKHFKSPGPSPNSTKAIGLPASHPNVTHPSSQPLRQKEGKSSVQYHYASSNHSLNVESFDSMKMSSHDAQCHDTIITADGVLELLDRKSKLIFFRFEEILPLGSRQVIGLQHDDHVETLVAKKITIRGIKCEESLPNLGSFGQSYDAQIANIKLIRQQSKRGSYFAKFSKDSRFGIFGNGPHTPGQPVSFGIWIKTWKSEEMILVHYGHNFLGETTQKDSFTLTLKNGIPRLYISPNGISIPENTVTLNDNKWHHIIVSMPRQNCKLSQVDIFINGKKIQTRQPYDDKNIFFITSGRISIGGFGHSNDGFESLYPYLSPYQGEVDDFSLWARPIEADDFPIYT